MPELRKDPVSDIWVVIAPDRKRRPLFYSSSVEYTLSPEDCPFCEGNESMTPLEVYAIRSEYSRPNEPGWQLRVIPNKYPALRIEGNIDRRAEGFYDKMNGIGAHEVVIETTSHDMGIDRLTEETVADVLLTYKRRILDLKRDTRFKYIQVFKNHGIKAGATLSHSHSQIVGMPVIPMRIKDRLSHSKMYYESKDRCIFCDIIQYELEFGKRVLFETADFVVLAPYAPRLPFELVIYPKVHRASFEEMEDILLHRLSYVYRETVARINKVLEYPSYNMLLQTFPLDREHHNPEHFHWHIEILPIITGTGGFEMGTQTYINSVSPEESIEIFKQE